MKRNVSSLLDRSRCVNVKSTVDVSGLHAASIFRVDVCNVGEIAYL
jgi:hypothetical protein